MSDTEARPPSPLEELEAHTNAVLQSLDLHDTTEDRAAILTTSNVYGLRSIARGLVARLEALRSVVVEVPAIVQRSIALARHEAVEPLRRAEEAIAAEASRDELIDRLRAAMGCATGEDMVCKASHLRSRVISLEAYVERLEEERRDHARSKSREDADAACLRDTQATLIETRERCDRMRERGDVVIRAVRALVGDETNADPLARLGQIVGECAALHARVKRIRLALGIDNGIDEVCAIRELADRREDLLARLRNLRSAIGADKLEHAAEDTPQEEALFARALRESRDVYKERVDHLCDALGVDDEVGTERAIATHCRRVTDRWELSGTLPHVQRLRTLAQRYEVRNYLDDSPEGLRGRLLSQIASQIVGAT